MNTHSQEPSYFPPTQDVADDLLQELEETMPQGVPNDTGLRRRATDNEPSLELDSLDALLSESMLEVAQREQYKKDREAQKRGFVGMSREEVEFCNSRLRAFELAREWDADRCIAVFIQFVCTKCQTGRTVFSRLMEHHQHRRNPTTHRWVTVADSKIPMETVLDQKEVPLCADCVEELGMQAPDGDDVVWLDDVLNERPE